ncbi:hypothetical protein IV203_018783 [Nitzschia inconspicua]|uniref:Uncharacterized protein n=1 Tax=Nitzschia inconspicua TaxID=303405 RepID=A0A9K3Q6W6_9STRA|nr:hypothetical protein IV203_018783 [Nitzschia inconspicua]
MTSHNVNDHHAVSTAVAADYYDRFELLCLHGSPYSERIRWALKVLQVDDYALLKHEVCTGELALRYKVGRWNPWHRVTVPVAFVSYADKNRPLLILEDGLDIVEWANDVVQSRRGTQENSTEDKKHALDLIPPSHRKEILEYCNIADETLDYGRGCFTEKLI